MKNIILLLICGIIGLTGCSKSESDASKVAQIEALLPISSPESGAPATLIGDIELPTEPAIEEQEPVIEPVINEFPLDMKRYVTLNNTTKRIYLMADLHSNYTYWESKNFISRMNADGYDVISFNLPSFDASMMVDGGAEYKAMYLDLLNRVVAESNALYGTASKNFIVGIGMGGLHALMGMSYTNYFDAYVAFVVTTKISAIAEYSGLDHHAFDAFNEVQALSNKRGLITWALDDTVVDWRLGKQLATDINAVHAGSVNTLEVVNRGHELSEVQMQTAKSFLNSL